MENPNVLRFTGFADIYDQYRPKPPEIIADLLLQLAGTERADHVVDLGCGTGLSTLIWINRTNSFTGIEPSADMRAIASQRPEWAFSAIRPQFLGKEAHQTGLTDQSIDIVTASQSFHWMDPVPTLPEIARILRPGGVFAAYDCDWPPVTDPIADDAFASCHRHADELLARSGISRAKAWPKDQHLDQIKKSGHFRYTRDLACLHTDSGNGDRLVGLIRSQGSIATLLKHGFTEAEIGLEQLRESVQQRLGERTIRWFWCYRIRVGIR
ncbi:MAG: class I SAM-dependent methyltransferase [Verrucomicrobia bacterium]|nr:class I SAM-dependent methyltransferase [Verrucomicrobiota bacterium]